MSNPELEKEGRQAQPTLAIDDTMRAAAPPTGSPSAVADLESSTSNLEKKESSAARRHQTRSTAVTDDEDDDPASLADTKASAKRSWWARLNPLRPKRKPPVPEERTVSPEYGASLWSRVTFRWMAPLMRVCV